MMKIIATFLILLSPILALAGNQQYEELSEETKNLMSKMVADSPPKISSFNNKSEEELWIKINMKKIAKYLKNEGEAEILLKTIHYESNRAGLSPELVMSLIEVESGFKKYAISSVGARGYMQVMPFWQRLIGQDNHNLFNLRTNLRYGCTILRHYVDIEKGDVTRALARYNGSIGKPHYPNAVLGAWDKKWKSI